MIDIANEVGVSRVAVSKVLHGTGGNNTRVSDETAERIRLAARRLNYRPNLIARQLAGKRSRIIGVVIDAQPWEVTYQSFSTMERVALDRGYRLMVGQVHGELGLMRAYSQDFSSRGVDGVICLAHSYPGISREACEIYAQHRNIVFYEKPDSKRTDHHCVCPDIRHGIREMVHYLHGKGCSRIALLRHIHAEGEYPVNRERDEGYAQGIRELGLPPMLRRITLPVEYGPQDLFGHIRDLVRDEQPDAILATNDLMALTVIRNLNDLGLRVPEDIRVSGHDNIYLGNRTIPALTTIDLRPEEVGRLAVDRVLDLIEGKAIPESERKMTVSPVIVPRESA